MSRGRELSVLGRAASSQLQRPQWHPCSGAAGKRGPGPIPRLRNKVVLRTRSALFDFCPRFRPAPRTTGYAAANASWATRNLASQWPMPQKRTPRTRGRLYASNHRACLLGASNACTNYAASIWAGEHSDDQLACARLTFEKACAAKEPFACGMVGRIMLESTTQPPYAKGRSYLEAACDDVGGFPCRVLAKHLESGKLGDYRPDLIRILRSRACAGGDPDACGGLQQRRRPFVRGRPTMRSSGRRRALLENVRCHRSVSTSAVPSLRRRSSHYFPVTIFRCGE